MQKLLKFRGFAVVYLTVIITTYAFTQAPPVPVSNPPWYPSLMAFEHYDSARTHLFEQAHFGGSFSGSNLVTVRPSPDLYPSGYNMVYMSPNEIFLYGGGYGNAPGSTGAFVAKVDPQTLKQVWIQQPFDVVKAGEWDYPGVVSLLDDGYLYMIYGYRLSKIDPKSGAVLQTIELPTGGGLKENTSFNGFDALPDHTLIAKTLYRQAGCTKQGPPALFYPNCPDPTDVPGSILVSINPNTMMVNNWVQLPGIVIGRPTTASFQGKDYVYMTNTTTAFRYSIENGYISPDPDPSWNPGNIYLKGQTPGSAVVMMNDWFVVQTNSGPTMAAALSVVVINQADASKQFTAQPFKGFPVPWGYPTSWAPMSVSVDPSQNLIYAIDSSPGMIAALKLTDTNLQTVWTAHQRTTEFLTLIGPPNRRVLVGTEIPPGQAPVTNSTDFVVWRDAQTGQELARTVQLPKFTSGTMLQPYYFGRMFYPGEDGGLFELNVLP
ncbi:MAG TPA: hypothetical protein VF783_10755 [Terriglobales bacterium]